MYIKTDFNAIKSTKQFLFKQDWAVIFLTVVFNLTLDD